MPSFWHLIYHASLLLAIWVIALPGKPKLPTDSKNTMYLTQTYWFFLQLVWSMIDSTLQHISNLWIMKPVSVATKSCRLHNVWKFICQPAAIFIPFILQTLLTKTHAHVQLMVSRVLKVRLCFQQTAMMILCCKNF